MLAMKDQEISDLRTKNAYLEVYQFTCLLSLLALLKQEYKYWREKSTTSAPKYAYHQD
jgi:hypothetical protein